MPQYVKASNLTTYHSIAPPASLRPGKICEIVAHPDKVHVRAAIYYSNKDYNIVDFHFKPNFLVSVVRRKPAGMPVKTHPPSATEIWAKQQIKPRKFKRRTR